MQVLLAVMLSAALSDGGQWPGFLGANATPIEPESVPLTWSPAENVAWRKPIQGYGQSSPVIWNGKVFVTSVEGDSKETLHIVCFDLESGELLWDRTEKSTHPEKNTLYISRAAPTPVVDANGIYAYFESGDVVALSLQGEPLWTQSLSKEYGPPKNRFGLSASPVQVDDRIVILIDDAATSYLVALDKKTGDVLWKTDRTSRQSWSSPALVEISGQPQVVCSSAGSVDGYDVTTGEQLWTFTEVGGNTGVTPLDIGDGRFLVGASAGRDGDRAELSRKSNGLMTVENTNGQWTPHFDWTNPEPSPSWGSPIAYRGYAYWVNRTGVVYCLDMNSGETVYKERLRQSTWATPVGIGDHIYVFGRDGLTTILSVGPEFKIVAENELWSADNPPANNTPAVEEEAADRRNAAATFSQPTVYGVAIVDGHIVIRTGSQLFCVRN